MTVTQPDLLDHLDAMARTSLTTPGEVRRAWLEAIQKLDDESGTFDAARIRATLPEHLAHGSEIGSLFRHLSKSGAARMVGTTASGYTEHRAGTTIIKVWSLQRRVFPEVAS